MNPGLEVQIIAILVSLCCSLLGVFLVLKKQAMLSDAISHTILLGIVLGFFVVHNINSFLLIFGAALVGILTVFLTDALTKTRIISSDSAIGIISPLLFSIGLVLISQFASNVHLDMDSVLLGELAFAPFDRLVLFGIDFGAKSIYVMLLILILNITFIIIFYKELKLSTFDQSLAVILGFSPILINYLFMGLVSITAVSAFNAVGSILVISLMVGPPITAYLITEDLKKMLIIAGGIGIVNAVVGFQVASLFDISIAGTISTVTGVVFLMTLLVSPKHGVIMTLINRAKQKRIYILHALLFHLYNHEDTQIESEEARLKTICEHLNWTNKQLDKILNYAQKNGYVIMKDGLIKLTECGRRYTIQEYQSLIESI